MSIQIKWVIIRVTMARSAFIFIETAAETKFEANYLLH